MSLAFTVGETSLKTKKRVFFLVVAMLIVANVYLFTYHIQQTQFECKGKAFLQNPTNSVDAEFYLLLYGNRGKIVVDGALSDASGASVTIRHMALIDVSRRGGSLFLSTYSSSRLPEDTDTHNLIRLFAPDFILKQGSKSMLTLETLPSGSILMSNNQSLNFYCEKTPE